MSPPLPTPKKRARSTVQVHASGEGWELLQKSERGKEVLVVSSCYEEPNGFDVEEGGGKNPRTNSKRRQRGDAGIRGSDIYLLKATGEERESWCLVGVCFWCHSR